jgi:putative copper export protein
MRTLLFIHLITMAFWLGGQLFMALVAVPALRSKDAEEREALFQHMGRWYGMVSVPFLLVLLGTGTAMMVDRNMNPSEIPALQHKLELVGLVLVALVVHMVAAANQKKRLSRAASVIGLLSTIGVVWYATAV